MAALLHDIGKPATLAYAERDGMPTFHGHEDVGAEMAEKILLRLKYPSDVIEVVKSHVAQHMRFRVAEEMSRAKLYRFVRTHAFPELLTLHRLDAASGSGNMKHAEFIERVLAEVPPERISPPKLLTGQDLIGLGLKPGPKFRELLEAVETAQLEGLVTTHGQAMGYVATLLTESTTGVAAPQIDLTEEL